MKKVHSFYNNIRIPKGQQQGAFLALKDKFLFNKEVKESSTLEDALKACNWQFHTDTFSKCISLKYEANDFPFKSEIALRALVPFVVNGGSIKIANENRSMYYNYICQDGELIKRTLSKEIIDFDDKCQVRSLFIRCARNLIRLGHSSTSLIKMIRRTFVSSILDS